MKDILIFSENIVRKNYYFSGRLLRIQEGWIERNQLKPAWEISELISENNSQFKASLGIMVLQKDPPPPSFLKGQITDFFLNIHEFPKNYFPRIIRCLRTAYDTMESLNSGHQRVCRCKRKIAPFRKS